MVAVAAEHSPEKLSEARFACEQFEAATESGELRALLWRVLNELNPEQRDVLLLHVILDYTVPEIARELGLGGELARTRLRRTYDRVSRLVASPPADMRDVIARLRELLSLHDFTIYDFTIDPFDDPLTLDSE